MFRMFPSIESDGRRFASPPQGPPGRVPLLQRYYQDAATSCRPSPRASLPSLGGTSVGTRSFRSSADEHPPPRPGVGNPVAPAGNLPRRRQDLPSSWGTPIVRLLMFFDSGRTACTRPLRSSSVALGMTKAKAPTIRVFRSSIAWLSDSLSTLRSAGYPNPTQDSLPAAGQALPDGLSTRWVPTKGFKAVSLHAHPPLPSIAWRNAINSSHKSRCQNPVKSEISEE